MNYKESALILEKIKRAKRILINCHVGPDPDSIGSALALYGVLRNLDKEAIIICPTEINNENLYFLKNFKAIKSVDFSKFDFSKFDLFITLDSSNWDQVLGSKSIKSPKIPTIVIDHHKTNTRFGEINLIDDKITSTGELLWHICEDWKSKIDKDTASAILTGIVGDTGAFQFPGVTIDTLNVVGELIKLGADKDEIIFHIIRTVNLELIKFWAEILKEMKIDMIGKFAWSAISNSKFRELHSPIEGKTTAASKFGEIIEGTKFGMIMVEQEKGRLSISFRSRTGFDTSKIAVALGGGGHIYASGAKVEGLPFKKAVEKVLETARKFAREKEL